MLKGKLLSPFFCIFQHMTAYTFRKEEKLCSQKIIGDIFLSGTSFLCYPLKVVWKYEELPTSFPAQVVFSVPKRLFKGHTTGIYSNGNYARFTVVRNKNCISHLN